MSKLHKVKMTMKFVNRELNVGCNKMFWVHCEKRREKINGKHITIVHSIYCRFLIEELNFFYC